MPRFVQLHELLRREPPAQAPAQLGHQRVGDALQQRARARRAPRAGGARPAATGRSRSRTTPAEASSGARASLRRRARRSASVVGQAADHVRLLAVLHHPQLARLRFQRARRAAALRAGATSALCSRSIARHRRAVAARLTPRARACARPRSGTGTRAPTSTHSIATRPSRSQRTRAAAGRRRR